MPSHRELANAIRALSMDAVQKANSGHPGMPMGMADIAEVLWNQFLSHNPKNPEWFNRDRFIISNGHGSMLQYSLLHLSGYAVSIDDLKEFRQLHSKTPGHPEYGCAPGIETTTGPLGQGIANAVGMALAERMLAAEFNRDNLNIVDHYTYVFAGDGCLMEGISHEACSLAGTLGLGKLILFYDDNGISIDGKVKGWFTDNTQQRFESYGWHVIANVDGHDPKAIKAAIESARSEQSKPTIICCKTIIAFGAPDLQGTAKSHGAPLGDEEIAKARLQLGWKYPPFIIPKEIKSAWEKDQQDEIEWQPIFDKYQKQHPALTKEFLRRQNGELPAGWSQKIEQHIKQTISDENTIATRKASLLALEALAPILPELIGGSADLSESNLTYWSGSQNISAETYQGNYIYYGVREFAMCAIMNGLALHRGFIPYGGTFLVFCDYARNAVRLSAMMKQRVIYVFTHDSIGLGEDGPTHQPIEHINMLRMTPELHVWRPCDSVETAYAWQSAIECKNNPSALLLSRQNLTFQKRSTESIANISRGGYVLKDSNQTPDVILIATGSEIELAVEAWQQCQERGIHIRVVSMPCVKIFEQQEKAYQQKVLPKAIKKRIAIEAGSTAFWYRYVGDCGKVIGIDRFGESAPAKKIFQALGITVENIIKTVEELLDEKIVENSL